MKRLILILCCLLLVCLLVTACTPDKEQDPKTTTPQPDVPVGSSEPGQVAKPSGGETAAPGGQTGEPAQTGEHVSDPGEVEQTATGLVIEDEHTETIGDNVGVGGLG